MTQVWKKMVFKEEIEKARRQALQQTVKRPNLEESFWEEMQKFEEERKMLYLTSLERSGFRRGMQLGMQQGAEAGWKDYGKPLNSA